MTTNHTEEYDENQIITRSTKLTTSASIDGIAAELFKQGGLTSLN